MSTETKSQSDKIHEAELAFDRKRRTFGMICGPIPDLPLPAHKLLAIMTLIALWWITEPIPIPVTSLLGPTLAVICGVVGAKDAYAAFANPMIFLFMGGFIIAKGMMMHGLDRKFAFALLSMSWVGSNPRRIFLAVGLACALCSGWVSNTATAAMMFPIALGLLEAIKEMFAANGKKIELHEYKYATGLMLMTAYSCSIGGVLTPIGTPPNIIMLGFLDQMAGIHISFFEWMIWGGAAMVVYFIIAYLILVNMFPAAMAGALLLFFLPVNWKEREFTLNWKAAAAGIEWGTLILFGGGLAMGCLMYKTGLSTWVGDCIVGWMGGEPSLFMMVAIFSVMALLLSELSVAVGIALSSSLGFMLPVSTPPNAIVYASGYVPITKMIKTGVYIDFIGIFCVTIPIVLYLVEFIVGAR